MATLLITNLGVVSRAKPCGCRERIICLQVKKVEGFLTGARHPRDGVAVSQCETQLHIYLCENTENRYNDHKLIRHTGFFSECTNQQLLHILYKILLLIKLGLHNV